MKFYNHVKIVIGLEAGEFAHREGEEEEDGEPHGEPGGEHLVFAEDEKTIEDDHRGDEGKEAHGDDEEERAVAGKAHRDGGDGEKSEEGEEREGELVVEVSSDAGFIRGGVDRFAKEGGEGAAFEGDEGFWSGVEGDGEFGKGAGVKALGFFEEFIADEMVDKASFGREEFERFHMPNIAAGADPKDVEELLGRFIVSLED